MQAHRAWALSPILLALTGCLGAGGGGEDTAGAGTSSVTVSGVAAVGAPLTGATVSLKCKANDIPATTTDAVTGAWSQTIPADSFPCVARAVKEGTTLHSLLDGAAGGAKARLNITTLTELLVARLAGSGKTPAQFFAAPVFPAITAQAIEDAIAAVRAGLPEAIKTQLGDAHPVRVDFQADATGHDAVLDALRQALADAGLTLETAASRVGAGTPLMPLILYASQTAAVGDTLSIGINGGALPANQAVTVKFGSTRATGTTNADGSAVSVTVPAALAGLSVAVTVEGAHGSIMVAVAAASGGGTGGTGDSGGTGGSAGAFPNEAITLPATALNGTSGTQTLTAASLASLVGTYTGIKAVYETNVLISDYPKGVASDACTFTVDNAGRLTLSDGVRSFSQVAGDGPFWDAWTPAGGVFAANTGSLSAGPLAPAAGMTAITASVVHGKLTQVEALVYKNPMDPFAGQSEKLTCWMPINRAPSATTGAWANLSATNAGTYGAEVVGTWTGQLFSSSDNAENKIVAAKAGETCQLVIGADGQLAFSTGGTAKPASVSARLAGDREDKTLYTAATDWSLTARDLTQPVSGGFEQVAFQSTSGGTLLNVSRGTKYPLFTTAWACSGMARQP